MEAVALRFELDGHTVSHRWWNKELHENGLSPQEQAERDIQGVKNAECLVVLNTAKSEGKAVEQGVAIAEEMPIVGIGTGVWNESLSNNVFHTLPNYIWVDDVEEALLVLAGMRFVRSGRFF